MCLIFGVLRNPQESFWFFHTIKCRFWSAPGQSPLRLGCAPRVPDQRLTGTGQWETGERWRRSREGTGTKRCCRRWAATAEVLSLRPRCCWRRAVTARKWGGPKQLGLPPAPTRLAAAAVWGGGRRPQPLSDHMRHGAWPSPPHSNRKACGWPLPHIASSEGAAAATQPQRI